MGHRKVFVVLFIFEVNSGVAVKRDHHRLLSHPSQFFHNHHFEITVLTVMATVQGCINSGHTAGEIKFYAVAPSIFCRGNGVPPPTPTKRTFSSHTPNRQTPDNDEVNISVESSVRTLLMSQL